MANVGSLARVALPEILKRIALNELSGSLEASSGKTARTIYFDRGFVVFTASTSKQDRLGQCLLEAGRVTRSARSRWSFASACRCIDCSSRAFAR